MKDGCGATEDSISNEAVVGISLLSKSLQNARCARHGTAYKAFEPGDPDHEVDDRPKEPQDGEEEHPPGHTSEAGEKQHECCHDPESNY